jgi:alcohol dehydrogenase class IV
MSKIGLQTRLSKVGVRERSDIDMIVENVNTERLINNPRAITKEQVRGLLMEII